MQVLMSDEHLVAQAKRGDRTAFDQLKVHNQRRVVSFCSRLLGNAAEGEQACQETFLLAWRRIESYRDESNFVSWLLKIAQNTCYNLVRTRKGQGQQNMISLDDPDWHADVEATPARHDPAREGSRRIFSRQLLQALQKRVAVHPPCWDQLDWDIFFLRVGQGEENFAEIARQLNGTVETVKYRYRAHILVAYAAVRKQLVVDTIGLEGKHLCWDPVDWELFQCVYVQGIRDYDQVEQRLRYATAQRLPLTADVLRRRCETVVLPLVAALETEMGAV